MANLVKYFLNSFKIKPWYLFVLVIFILGLAIIRFLVLYTEALNYIKSPDVVFIFFQTLIEIFLALIIGLFVITFDFIISDYIRHRPPFLTYLERTNNILRLLGFTLRDFHDDKKKEGSNKYFIKILEDKFKEDGEKEFQFLLLDPFSDAFIKKSKFENKDHNVLRLECAKSVSNIKKLKEKFLDQKEIDEGLKHRIFNFKFYENFPTHSLIINDDTVWVGPYLHNTSGIQSKWFQIRNYTALKEYLQEFNDYWSSFSYDEHTFLAKSDPHKRKCYNNLLLIQKNMPEIVDDLLKIQKSHKNFGIPNKEFTDLMNIAELMEIERQNMMNLDLAKPDIKIDRNLCTISYHNTNHQITIQLPIPEK